MNDTAPPSSTLLKVYALAVRWVWWMLLGAALLLLGGWASLQFFIVPRIDELRPALESQASRALGVTVRIGEIRARFEGIVPTFEAGEVSLHDRDGREALRLPRVVVSLSPRSLIDLGFDQLYIEQPELDVRRTASGQILVAGLDMGISAEDDGRLSSWFFRQREVVILGGTLRWTDEMRRAPALSLQRVDLVVRNSGRRHDLRLDATPREDWGQRFTLRGRFRQPLLSVDAGRWQAWSGELFGNFPAVDLAQLMPHLPLGVQVREGHGALRLWADIDQGQFSSAVADVLLSRVAARLDEKLEPLEMLHMSGRLGGRRLANGFSFSTSELQFSTRDGLMWPGGNVALTWTGAEAKIAEQGDFRADRLDLAALARVAQRLPLDASVHQAIAAYAPGGLVESLQLRWQGPLGQPTGFSAKGRASGLALAARPAAGSTGELGGPGLRGATVDFEADQGGGRAKLLIERGALEFPGVFDEPLVPMDRLSADLSWTRRQDQWKLNIASLKFSNADMQGQAQGQWQTADAALSPAKSSLPGVLDLSGELTRADGARVYRYLPRVMARSAREYVRDAVPRAEVTQARFRVKGDLHDMPFENPRRGEFSVSARIVNATFAYVPRGLQPAGAKPWPAFTQMSAELQINRQSLQIRGARARVAGQPVLQLVRADARIADLAHAVVEVTGELRGSVPEVLDVVRSTPVSGFTAQALDRGNGSGGAEVRLALVLPIEEMGRSRVQGSVNLVNAALQVAPDAPQLSRIRGVVNFTETGFSLSGVQARMYGGDARIDGGSRSVAAGASEAPIWFRAQGSASAEGLRQAGELGFVARLAQRMHGSTGYSATLAFRRDTPEVSVSSNLQGLHVDLPAPLNKTAEAVLPLRYENALTRESLAAGARRQDLLSVELGRLAAFSYLRELDGAQQRVLRGSVAIGLEGAETVAMGEQGVAANIRLAQVDVDAWESALAGVSGAPVTGEAASGNLALSYLPQAMAVRARQVTLDGRTLHNVVLGGMRAGRVWRANVDADELSGYVEYRPGAGSTPGRVYARLARLLISSSAQSGVESLLEEEQSTVPALDVVVDRLQLRNLQLGRLEIDAVNQQAAAGAGAASDWRLNRLVLQTPEAQFSASGQWSARAATSAGAGAASGPQARRRTQMNFRLDISDSGALLERLGQPGSIRGGKGRLEGQVSWRGSPLSFDYPSMNGAFNVAIESGQFLKAEPGIAKLLGVLSLQSLPRRLILDFRDVFSEGFVFDFVRGDVTIQQGIASTNNLQMKGVNAAVLMDGRTDIARETQSIRVVVVPEINAGTASLVAATINPVVGLGSFLAQLFLRNPLIRAATQEFQVEGSWSDPRVVRVERRAEPSPGNNASP